ncbi:MAG: hypothetical protein ACO3F2_00580 [Roseiflexaceae bacterium]
MLRIYLFFFVVLLMVSSSGCTSTKYVPLVTYHAQNNYENSTILLHIDANGYVIRTVNQNTDEFQLADDDFGLILDQLQEVPFDRLDRRYLPEQDAINLTQYTISYQDHVVEMTDTAVPNIMAPLMLSFRRIIAVEL